MTVHQDLYECASMSRIAFAGCNGAGRARRDANHADEKRHCESDKVRRVCIKPFAVHNRPSRLDLSRQAMRIEYNGVDINGNQPQRPMLLQSICRGFPPHLGRCRQ